MYSFPLAIQETEVRSNLSTVSEERESVFVGSLTSVILPEPLYHRNRQRLTNTFLDVSLAGSLPSQSLTFKLSRLSNSALSFAAVG